MKVTDDEGHDETQVITLTVDPVNDAGAFSGDTSGTGAEDAEDDITGTLTFTDAIDGDSAELTFHVSSDASNGTASVDAVVPGRTYRMSTSTDQIPLLSLSLMMTATKKHRSSP